MAYPNRSDLNGPQPVRTVPSASYGAATAQAEAQRAVPIAPPPSSAPPTTPAGGGAPMPGGFGDPLRPTERPSEPMTAGLPYGPGPGPEALGMAGNPDRDLLGAIYAQFPTEGLRELLEILDEEA